MTDPQHRPVGLPLLNVPRDGATVTRRLPRPVLLMAVLLLLFLPFLTVSCSSPYGGSIDVEFTGWDSTLGTEPSVRGAEGFGDGSGDSDSADTPDATPRLQLLSLITTGFGLGFLAVVVANAALLAFLRSTTARSVVAAAGAVLAAGFDHRKPPRLAGIRRRIAG